MNASPIRAAVAALLLTAVAGPALAHVGVGPGAGLAAGAGHPFAGLDHVLAMVAVGLWAAQLGGRARWLVPAAFLLAMAAGGIVGAAGGALPLAEAGVAASVLGVGAAVLLAVRVPTLAAAVAVAVFAVFHGHVHGAGMPAGADGALYGLGFLAATAALHGLGLGAGLIAAGAGRPLLVRIGGGAVAAAGLVLVAAA